MNRQLVRRLVIFAFAFVGSVGLGCVGLLGYVWIDLSSRGLLKIPAPKPGILIVASDGTELAISGPFRGDEVKLSELPDYVPNAFIAIEDRRFRSHPGVDPVGLVRALLVNAQAGEVVQGGSTITQQLVKNLMLSPDRTVWRKLQEGVLAMWIEAHCTKDEILELYINRVYYGAGSYGLESAAQNYFGKSARLLNLGEAATLAGVVQAPTSFNPIQNPLAAAQRAKLVIHSMVNAGFLREEDAVETLDHPPAIKLRESGMRSEQYIANWVYGQIPGLLGRYEQSIIVETTIDRDIQSAADRSFEERLDSENARLKDVQGALVVMDSTGAVRAMIGGRSDGQSQFNRATSAKRQPGSAFKPFVYAAALEQGYGPDSIMVDERVRIGNWEPENYRAKYLGGVTLEKAIALSLNTVAAKLIQSLGPEKVIEVARRLGIESPLNNSPSIALGTSEVTLLEMTGGFSPFSNGGYRVDPYVIRRISTRDGRTLYQHLDPRPKRVVEPYVLAAMNHMLRTVISRGTGKKARIGNIDIAGKTGTSQDYRDAWFIGYSAEFVAAVWMGKDDSSPMNQVTGGSTPAEIWHDVMIAAHRRRQPIPLPGGDYQEVAVAEREADLLMEVAAFELAGLHSGERSKSVGRRDRLAVDNMRKTSRKDGAPKTETRGGELIESAGDPEGKKIWKRHQAVTSGERGRRIVWGNQGSRESNRKYFNEKRLTESLGHRSATRKVLGASEASDMRRRRNMRFMWDAQK